MPTALAFHQVSKRFVLQHERPQSFQERFVQLFRGRPTTEEFWVLRDVTFAVEDGQTFGIIGRNGAGKSTLLKLATGILQPTSGQVERRRRTYAMLELGAGFHPELSGRDNIYLSGSIHGLRRPTMRQLFDKIVAFAELERFIDTPVKHYSSGMFMRLGFAIAVHMQPELLIIDEILAVGDAAFRRKCTESLWDLKRQGVTLLFVSHNEEAVYQFCDRALLLAGGQLVTLGPVDEVIATYTRLTEAQSGAVTANGERGRILALAALDAAGHETITLRPDEPWAIEVVVALPGGHGTVSGEVTVHTETGSPVIVARLAEATLAPGPTIRYLRAQLDPVPFSAGRLRLGAQLALPTGSGGLHQTLYESPNSIMIGGQSLGALLNVPYRWAEHTDATHPRALTIAAEPAPNGAPAAVPARAPGYRPLSQRPLSGSPLADQGTADSLGTGQVIRRYVAEGYTGDAFDTYLTLVNPGLEAITVALTAHYGRLSSGVEQLRISLPAQGCQTLVLDELLGSGQEFALTLQSDRPFYAERAIFFQRYPATGGIAYNRPQLSTLATIGGGHLSLAAEQTATSWYFAEGYTGDGFELYYLLQNPAATATTIELTYYLDTGEQLRRTLLLASGQRLTVPAHGLAESGGIGAGQTFSTIIRATESQGIVVERVTYFRYHGSSVRATGATISLGATAPATDWAFAEGSTEPGHEQFFSLLNPTSEAGTARLTYYLETGAPIIRTVPLAAGQRSTVFVHAPQSAHNPGGLGPGQRPAVLISSSVPIVAERPLYFAYDGLPGEPIDGGHTTLGATRLLQAGERLVLVDAYTGPGFHQYLVVLNPNAAPARLALTYLLANGPPVVQSFTVEGERRTVVALHQRAPLDGVGLGPDQEASLLVTVEQVGARGLLVERVTYFRYGQQASGGAVSFGAVLGASIVNAPVTAGADPTARG